MIVVAVPANPIWKMKKAISSAVPSPEKNAPDQPNQPPTLSPNIKANPNAQNTAVVRQKSAKFLAATLMLFLVRTSPVSSDEKPACMNMTRAADTRIQAMSIASADPTAPPGPGRVYVREPGVFRLLVLPGGA